MPHHSRSASLHDLPGPNHPLDSEQGGHIPERDVGGDQHHP